MKIKKLIKVLSIALCFMLVAAAIPPVHHVFAAVQQLNEDFEGFPVGTTFKTNDGEWRTNTSQADWEVVEDGDENKAIKLSSTGTSSSAFLTYTDEWTDFTYTAKMKIENTSRAGIVGRFLNGNNYYLLSLSGGNKLELRMKSAATGSSVTNLETAEFNYNVGEYYTLTLKIEGDQLTGSVEGGPTITATDTNLEGPGKIGFYIGAKETTLYFDDATAEALVSEDEDEGEGGDSGDPDEDEEETDEIPNKLTIVEVTASGHDGNFPENVNDDDLTTRWSAQSALDEDGVTRLGQWIQFDLGTKQTVSYMGIAFYSGDKRSSSFDIEASDDGETWTKIYSGESSGTSVDLQGFELDDFEAKYVRYVGYGNSVNLWNSLSVVHIYGPSTSGNLVLAKLNPPPPEVPGDMTPYTVAGLFNADGTPHVVHTPNEVTGVTIDITSAPYNAIPNDGLDDVPAILAAIDAAQPGDEIYFPDGTYDLISTLPTDGTSNLTLKSFVNLRGESEEGTILLSHFDNSTSNSKVISGYAKHDILISDLTISSTFSGAYSTNHQQNNPERGGPFFGIVLEDGLGQPSYNVTIDKVTVEKFQKIGVRISKSRDIVVRNSTFQNMTDVGGGGAGYGVSIQGIAKVDRLGYANDTKHNLIENSRFIGPYMRHGVIIQYYAHNNEVRDSYFELSKLDAIDLHGELEYLNKIHGNEITGVLTGAGIALGNTGGTAPSNHSASGPHNHIYNNTITNSREGIKVHMGTPDTLIEGNTITGTAAPNHARGILIQNGPRTIIKDNIITNNTAENFWGILLETDPGDTNAGNVGAGDPIDVQIIGNTITGNSNGLRIDAGTGTILLDNDISGNIGVDLQNNTDEEPTGPIDPDIVVEAIHPTDDAKVDVATPEINYGYAGSSDVNPNWHRLFNVKSNPDKTTGRSAFFKFEITDSEQITEALLELTARTGSNTTEVTLDIYGLLDDSWDEQTITWSNAPNLHDTLAEVTGIGESAFLLNSFTINDSSNSKYTIDVTDFVKQQSDGVVTLLIVDSIGQDKNVNILSKEDSNSANWPVLNITKGGEDRTIEEDFELSNISFTDFNNNVVTALTNEGFLKVNVDATNNTDASVDATMIVALYKPDHSVVRIAYSEQSLSSKQTVSMGAGFNLPADVSGHYVKVMVWDSVEGMQPLVKPIVFPAN